MIDLGIVLDKAEADHIENAEISNYQASSPLGYNTLKGSAGHTRIIGSLRRQA